ncbi:SPOR domain-containing protein [Sphingomonas sp. CFBP 8760]|uniref:SPOR domain-containing protein n=1 Tax=Sphingomonas sp. CFBP 8760 TaxID=2775282 RepID=UPI001FCE31DD|nr:SPOR domain-containing protein [Sphingomonas sp. CFBP 8760]
MTKMTRRIGGWMAAAAVAAMLVGCGHRERPTPPVPVPEPSLTPASPPPPPPPTINSGLGDEEALWHLRAALNVAALGCGQGPAGAGIVTRYNALLIERKAVLATAYAAEKARYGTERGALDRHMTQLYNFFADPAAQRGFCAAAADVAEQVAATPAAALPGFAATALEQLERPVVAPRMIVASTARAAASAPETASAPTVAPAPTVAAAATPTASAWRIQIGAFTGQAAAEAAWARATTRVPSLGGYSPIYQPVPGKPLVRVQVGAADDRAGAIQLCAAAAAGGFDCMPVTARR